MRRENLKLKPDNDICECECHSDSEVHHNVPCCFECPKCHENIISHLYNAHVECCSRSDKLKKRREQKEKERLDAVPETNTIPKKKNRKRLVDRPTLPGSAKTRYRKR